MGADDIAGLHGELRALLNGWDPLGVAHAVDDEYDGLAGLLLARLAGGASQAEMGEFLWFEVEELYGIDPARCEADAFGARLATWYQARRAG